MNTDTQSQTPTLLWSVQQTGDATGLSRSLLYDLLRTGEIRSFKVGRRRLIPADELDVWIRTCLERTVPIAPDSGSEQWTGAVLENETRTSDTRRRLIDRANQAKAEGEDSGSEQWTGAVFENETRTSDTRRRLIDRANQAKAEGEDSGSEQ